MYKILVFVVLTSAFAQNNTSIDGEAAIKQIFAQNNSSVDSEAAVKQIFAQNNTSIDGEAAVKQIFAQNNSSVDSQAAVKQIFAQNNSSIDGRAARGQIGSEQISNQNNTVIPGAFNESNDTCLTTSGVDGECVLYYLCDEETYFDSYSPTDFHVNFTQKINASPGDLTSECEAQGYLYVCCPKANRIDLRSGTTAKPQPMREGCGWRNPDGVGFQIAGDARDEITKFAEFPWIAAILKIENDTNQYIGSGSLIHPNVVLTAAHYVDSSQKMRVRIGEWDTQTTKEIYPYQDRDVAKVEIHKDFNKGALFYDIALLFLASPVEAAPNVGVVCLPPTGQRAMKGIRCLSTGWGKDKFGKEGLYSVLLQKVEIPVVERKECLQSLRKTRLGDLFELHSSFMCAGGEPGKDACKGDSGSPLVCPIENDKNRFVQNGIVAWGIGCGTDGTPGVYVDVANLREWIDDKVKGQGYEIVGYSYTV